MRGGGALETTRQKGRSAGCFHQERYGSFIVGCFVKRRIARDYRRERRCEPGAGGCDWEARYKHRRTAVYGGSSSREGTRVMAYSRESKRGTASFRAKLRKLEREGKLSQAKHLRE